MEQAKQLLSDDRFDAALLAYQEILNASIASGVAGMSGFVFLIK
jgi:hypothetical protein